MVEPAQAQATKMILKNLANIKLE